MKEDSHKYDLFRAEKLPKFVERLQEESIAAFRLYTYMKAKNNERLIEKKRNQNDHVRTYYDSKNQLKGLELLI